MKIPLYKDVSLRIDVLDKGLQKGDIVTTVEFLEARRDLPNAYVVEAFNAVGDTIAVFTVAENNLELLTEHDVIHIRHNSRPVEQLDPSVEEPSDKPTTSLATDSGNVVIALSEEALKLNGISRETVRLQLALFLFQQDLFSIGKASKLAGLHPTQFQKELARQQISVHYDSDDYAGDLTISTQPRELPNYRQAS